MRYNLFSQLIHGYLCRALSVCAALTVLSACNDDAFDSFNKNSGDSVDFSVSLTESWHSGNSHSSEPKVNIREMDSPEVGKPLYLVTTVTSLPDSVKPVDISPRQSRGTSISPDGDFHPSFGLSAICYNGSWPDGGGDWTTNFCHNLKMTATGNEWLPDADKELGWTGSGRIRFFAYAPHSTDEHVSITHRPSDKDHTGVPEIEFTVNSVVKNQIDLLTAVSDCSGAGSGSADGKVTLAFGHALTAVTVKAGSAMLAGKIKSVSLENVYGSGVCSTDLVESVPTVTWKRTGNAAKDKAVTFSIDLTADFADGKPLDPDNDKYDDNHYGKPGDYIVDGDLTLFMIPQTLPTDAKLRIVFIDELTDEERTLTADLSGQTWAAGHRVEYAVSSTGVKATPIVNIKLATEATLPYTGVVDVESMQAYMKVSQVGKDDVFLPLKVRLASSLAPDASLDFTVLSKPSDDVKAEKSGILHMQPQDPYKEMRKSFDDLGYSKKYIKAADGGPMDLSKFDGIKEDGRTESSNTYVINAPGLYKLPLVYGNSLGNDGAYRPGVTKDEYVWDVMVDHKNNPITNQWIPDQHPDIEYVPELLWQDSPGLIRERSLKLSEDKRYLQFEIREVDLNQGNAHIAIKDPSTGEALWSWQIYVTHYDWTGSADVTLTSRASNLSHDIAPANVGYCDMHIGASERKQNLIVYAIGADGKETAVKTIEFMQEGIAASSAGDNTYYQMGRKDPVPGGIYSSATKDNYLIGREDAGEEYNMISKPVWTPDGEPAVSTGESMVQYHESIKHPDVFYIYHNPTNSSGTDADHRRRMWSNDMSLNIWDGGRIEVSYTKEISDRNDAVVRKTVYDPSPRSYNISHVGGFHGLIDDKIYDGLPNKDKNSPYKASAIAMWKEGKDLLEENFPNVDRIENDGLTVGWVFTVNGKTVNFYCTGVRDMGCSFDLSHLPQGWANESWPAFHSLTFVYSASFFIQGNTVDGVTKHRIQSVAFGLDDRHVIAKGVGMDLALSSNGAYGMAVRPERSKNN